MTILHRERRNNSGSRGRSFFLAKSKASIGLNNVHTPVTLDKRFKIISKEREMERKIAMVVSEVRRMRAVARQAKSRNQALVRARNNPANVSYASINTHESSILGRPERESYRKGFYQNAPNALFNLPDHPTTRGILPLPEYPRSILGNPYRREQHRIKHYTTGSLKNMMYSATASVRGRESYNVNFKGRAGGRGVERRGDGKLLSHEELDKDLKNYMLNIHGDNQD